MKKLRPKRVSDKLKVMRLGSGRPGILTCFCLTPNSKEGISNNNRSNHATAPVSYLFMEDYA